MDVVTEADVAAAWDISACVDDVLAGRVDDPEECDLVEDVKVTATRAEFADGYEALSDSGQDTGVGPLTGAYVTWGGIVALVAVVVVVGALALTGTIGWIHAGAVTFVAACWAAGAVLDIHSSHHWASSDFTWGAHAAWAGLLAVVTGCYIADRARA
jgi:hypothetical protein